jgi:hypothetical protein
MRTIILEVNDNAAERYLKMSDAEKKTISKEFGRLLTRRRTLREVMDDLSEHARKKGLTPEILDDILKDE